MTDVLETEQETATMPARRQAHSAQAMAAAQRVQRLRQMEAFFRSLPQRRAAAGLGPVPDNIREMAYEEREAAPS